MKITPKMVEDAFNYHDSYEGVAGYLNARIDENKGKIMEKTSLLILCVMAVLTLIVVMK